MQLTCPGYKDEDARGCNYHVESSGVINSILDLRRLEKDMNSQEGKLTGIQSILMSRIIPYGHSNSTVPHYVCDLHSPLNELNSGCIRAS